MSPASVSVVVVVKDGEPYLAEALHSIANQTRAPQDVIVVDGGSRDRSVEIARSFSFTRVLSQRGTGIADAYNTGIAEAAGELTAFLSSDDRWTPDKLERQLDHMHAYPDLQLTVCKAHFMLERGRAIPSGFRPELLDGDHEAWIMETLMARRWVWEHVGGFDTTLPLAEDVDWFSRARHLQVPMAVVPHVLLHKRIHGGNASLDAATNNRALLRVVRQSIRRRRGASAMDA
ncbi:MAG: glycosyltransferase [Vicinamibacterales bacterium]